MKLSDAFLTSSVHIESSKSRMVLWQRLVRTRLSRFSSGLGSLEKKTTRKPRTKLWAFVSAGRVREVVSPIMSTLEPDVASATFWKAAASSTLSSLYTNRFTISFWYGMADRPMTLRPSSESIPSHAAVMKLAAAALICGLRSDSLSSIWKALRMGQVSLDPSSTIPLSMLDSYSLMSNRGRKSTEQAALIM